MLQNLAELIRGSLRPKATKNIFALTDWLVTDIIILKVGNPISGCAGMFVKVLVT